MYYYFTIGPTYKKTNISDKRFYTSFNDKSFNLEKIQNILLNEKINLDYIDNYRYYDSNKKGYIKINENKDYLKPSNKFILELHYKIYDPILYDFDNLYTDIKYKYKKIANKVKELNIYNKNNNNEYDLIYLYASPLVDNYLKEEFVTISYRLEIKKILQLMTKEEKQFNCLFECANEKTFRNLIKKPTKILHISAHGGIGKIKDFKDYKNKYYLILEENGEYQNIKKENLNEIIKTYSKQIEKIDLIFISTCFSQCLGELFYENNAKNVIYIDGLTPVSNLASVKFTEYLYEELIKGKNIIDAYNKSKKRLKLNRVMKYDNPNNTCASHKHTSECKIGDNSNYKYYKKICNCKYDEFNIHRKDCSLIKSLLDDKNERVKFTFKYYKDKYLKICCCGYKTKLDKYIPNSNNENKKDNDEEEIDITHNEYDKFILKSRKGCENIILFQNNKEGKVIKNKNIIFSEKKKDFSIIGNRKTMKIIYDIIADNTGLNEHLIIIYGSKHIGKQNFVESLCVYLFERKIISNFSEIIEIEKELDILKIENEISKYKKCINNNEKYIIIGKISSFLNENNSLILIKYILSKLENFDKNFYFIIIFDYDNILNIETKCNIINLKKLEKESAQKLLIELCEFCGYNFCYSERLTDNLFQIVKYEHNKIIDIVQFICQGASYEELEELIRNKINKEKIEDIEIEKILNNNNLIKILFLLSIMPSGIPYSLIKLIYPEINILEEKDKINIFIYQDSKNWFHISKNSKKIIFKFENENFKNIKEECISNCLKIYARLLFFYIQENRKDIYFPDNNIHYIFNSFNGKGLWKTFNEDIYKKCFPYNNEEKDNQKKDIINYNNILKDDFDLEKYKYNILYFIENNFDSIKSLISKENKNKDTNKEFLEQILLMLPSCFFLSSICKNLINKCINIFNLFNILELELGSKRLLLFLKSLENNPIININDFEFDSKELLAEAYFLKGLKDKDKNSFEKSKEIYEKLNNELREYKISYINYELAALFFCEKNYKYSEKYLNEAKTLAKKNKNNFLYYRCNIELALIIHNKSKSSLNDLYSNLKINNYLIEAINIEEKEELNYFQKEPYELKKIFNHYLEPDITILNSNPLINIYNVLTSGIYAYHNNHYYILQKIYEKINENITVKSKLLNKDNLLSDLNQKGRILIIQSDDFSENGEIILETDMGESQVLPNDNLKKSLKEKIKYDVVILCFLNSIKLKNIFKDRTQYLITFNEINYCELDYNTLLTYNELSIEFLINFITKTIEKNIEDSFEESKEIFNNKFNNKLKKFKKFNNQNFIDLKKPEYNNINKNIKYIKNKFYQKEKIFFYYPLLNLNTNASRSSEYFYNILDIVKEVIESKKRFITINIKLDNKKKNQKKKNKAIKQIGIEVMRFFHRHQIFNRLFCIFKHQNIKIDDIQSNESILIYINDKERKNEDLLENFDNVKYLFIENNEEMEINRKENKTLKKNLKKNKNFLEKNNTLFKNFESIFTYEYNEEEDYI